MRVYKPVTLHAVCIFQKYILPEEQSKIQAEFPTVEAAPLQV